MIIDLSDSRRIVGTKHAWELQRLRSRGGKPYWEPFKWFSSLSSAVSEAVHAEIRTHPAKTVSEALDAVSAICARYTAILPPSYFETKGDGHSK